MKNNDYHTRYPSRLNLLNTHEIPYTTTRIDEVVLVTLLDGTQVYVSLKPHYTPRHEVGFLHRFYAQEEWSMQPTTEFLGWLRLRLGLPDEVVERPGYRLPFGKYKTLLASDIVKRDPDYVRWMVTKSSLADAKKKHLNELLDDAGEETTDYDPTPVLSFTDLVDTISAAPLTSHIKFIAGDERVLVEDPLHRIYCYYQPAPGVYEELLACLRPAMRGVKAKQHYTQAEASAAAGVEARRRKLSALVTE